MCKFTSMECFYKHEKAPNENVNDKQQDLVFQVAQSNNHPPDMMHKILSIVEKLMDKVSILEGTNMTRNQ